MKSSKCKIVPSSSIRQANRAFCSLTTWCYLHLLMSISERHNHRNHHMLHNIPPCYFQFSFISMITAIKNMMEKKPKRNASKATKLYAYTYTIIFSIRLRNDMEGKLCHLLNAQHWYDDTIRYDTISRLSFTKKNSTTWKMENFQMEREMKI